MLKPLLEEFLKIEGVSAAVVVGRIGFVIESAVSGKIDIEALGAMAPRVLEHQKQWASPQACVGLSTCRKITGVFSPYCCIIREVLMSRGFDKTSIKPRILIMKVVNY